MDRDILFRGKRMDNGEWVKGYYFKSKYYRGDSELCDYISIPHPCERNRPSDNFLVVPATVGQYTGLDDSAGNKIFEGDIVKLHNRHGDWIAEVVFGNPNGLYSWGWQLSYISGVDGYNKDILLWVDMEEVGVTCEVVGNVFDGSKLLEV